MLLAKRMFSLLTPIALLGCLNAQWVPAVANIRTTTEVVRDGKVINQRGKEGAFYRTESGTTLTHWTKIDGVDQPGTGSLTDNEKLMTFQLDYATRSAKQSPYLLPEAIRPDVYSKTKSLGQSVVNGISCKLIPVEIEGPQQPVERVGEACVSVEYGLLLRQTTNVTRKDGTIVRATLEMYDVKLNVKPNPEEFDLERSFTISRPEHTLLVPTPKK